MASGSIKGIAVIGGIAALVFSATASAQGNDQAWNDIVAAARKEGKVVVLAPPDPQFREELPPAFKARFGITLEYYGGRSSEIAVKLRAERQAGVATVDAALSGIQTMATIFYREGMLAPLKPVLMMPEVVDPTKWKAGKLWFMDPEEQYILRLFNSVSPSFHVNTQYVKLSEFKSAQDLINPKWRGKISLHDPTVPGTGSNTAARLYVQFGEAYLKKLFIDQKPAIARDRRQLTDWLARGSFPISLAPERDEVDRMRADGFPIEPVISLPDLPATLSAGVGLLAIFNNAPNPNAARVFANWIASKEGLEVFVRTRGESPTRNDIDERKLIPEGVIPKPGENYFDTFAWDFTVTTKETVRLRMKDLLEAK
jgi:iron(III) transport system substrate-binding protein